MILLILGVINSTLDDILEGSRFSNYHEPSFRFF
nr:MAG TPA: hypothetical protein [Caudoviricetes sp.]